MKFRHYSEAITYQYHGSNRIHFHKDLLDKNIFHAINKNAFNIEVNVIFAVQIVYIVWSSAITKELFSHLAANVLNVTHCSMLISDEIYLSTCIDSL